MRGGRGRTMAKTVVRPAPKVLRRRVFTTWQQIADYLGVTIRTAQRWKNERGLPVFTKPLQACADMLDQWASGPNFPGNED